MCGSGADVRDLCLGAFGLWAFWGSGGRGWIPPAGFLVCVFLWACASGSPPAVPGALRGRAGSSVAARLPARLFRLGSSSAALARPPHVSPCSLVRVDKVGAAAAGARAPGTVAAGSPGVGIRTAADTGRERRRLRLPCALWTDGATTTRRRPHRCPASRSTPTISATWAAAFPRLAGIPCPGRLTCRTCFVDKRPGRCKL